MTHKELKALVGNKPFVWTCSLTDVEFISLFVEEIEIQFENDEVLLEYPHPQVNDNSEIRLPGLVIVDYFESSPRNCKCDWTSVLQMGCKCGAIIPYERRASNG